MQIKLSRTVCVALCLVALLAGSFASFASAQEPEIIDIPYEKFVLDNGLTLIVHEDHKAPIVAVNMWYHVGSKNEKEGRTGFAHLFEHLMFNGSENYDDDYFKVLQKIGATGLNGTTNNDRTNYFENVPKTALDTVLWMESDRMGHLLGAITQEKLDEQRGVVQNEKRQGENQPYGKAFDAISTALYPKGHPYSWSVIGSMEDLNAAALEDVHEWFKTYYGAANTVIVVAGDIDVATAKAKVEKYFGDIPSGPPVTALETWIPTWTSERRQVMQDRVPQARIYKFWAMPQEGSADADYLDFVTDVLASGKTSRLYKRLVYDEQKATSISAFVSPQEIAGIVGIIATVSPGTDPAEVEAAVNEEVARFLDSGATAEELDRIKTQRRASFIRGVERIGGFGGKSDVLAASEVYGGSPGAHKESQRRLLTATREDLLGAAGRWMSEGAFVLRVDPFPKYSVATSDVDRSAVPVPGPPPDAAFPKLQRAELKNGLKIILAERHTVPQVNFNLQIDAGYAADQFGAAGTASMAMAMLDEGTAKRNALQISEELQWLGARIGAGSNLDTSSVTLSALKDKLDESLDLYADVILNPAFPQEELDRLRPRTLAGITQEQRQPVGMALRVFPGLLYGEGHAYGNPFTGSGTKDTVTAMTRDDLVKFHRAWFKPNNATMIVVGDTTLDEIVPRLETLFSRWKKGKVSEKNIATVKHQDKSAIYIMDRPGAEQSFILAAHVAPPKANPEEIAIEAMNTVLGGGFVSRINMNLREDKHWSYGSQTIMVGARGQRPFIVFAPVQTDKTKESMAEILKELKDILKSRPIDDDELSRAKASRVLTLAGQWETMGAVGGSIAQIVRYGLPDDYFDTYSGQVNALKTEALNKAAGTVLRPGQLIWVVVGDREKIEAGVRELGFAEVHLMDAEGKIVSGN